jgi:hypothetical protein
MHAPSASTTATAERPKILIPDMVRRAREGFLKLGLASALGAALASVSLPAIADELVVGAIRDQDGAIVAGAGIAAFDAAGRVLGQDRSAADGTFALATPTRPVAVVITARDADSLRLPVPADGSPLAAIVRRHRAADLIPSVADIAALPAGSLSALAEMVPYRVAFPTTISDRWLARGRSVTTVEGLPFYRRGDGGDATSLLPSHAIGSLGVRDALQAPWYGDRAAGGIIDARLFDRADTLRATNGDAAVALGSGHSALAAASWDPDGARRLFAARASETFGPVSADAVALVGTAPGATYGGAGAQLRASGRLYDFGAHVAISADDASTNATRNDGSVTDFAADASGRGPNAIAVRARWRDERGMLGTSDAEHHDAALVFGTSRGNVVRATTALALTYGDEHSYETGTQRGYALLPSLAIDAPLGANWSAHAGAGASSLGTPGYAIARSSLGEIGVAYADRRRISAELIAYTEGTTAPIAVNRGFAAELGWEIAPRVSLRAWTLRDGDALDALTPAYPGGPLQTIVVRRRFYRDVVWLTWDAPARFDLLVRAGLLEGSVRVPLGRRYALTAGSFVRSDATRTLSFGLISR